VISNGQLGLSDGQQVAPLDKSAKNKTVAER
jgi:hypothetical protein